MVKICLCFGGPSEERNISAGSLKPWVTWLAVEPEVELSVLFFDRTERAWVLPRAYHYAGTCEDFEGQLAPDTLLTEEALDRHLLDQDVVVPLIHGAFGEDGRLQQRLETLGVAYVFSPPSALADSFDKARCYERLAAAGLPAPEHFRFDAAAWSREPEALFARARRWARGEGDLLCAVKPNRGGSSIGVRLVPDDRVAFERAVRGALELDDEVLVEAMLGGIEVSIVVLENEDGPLALLPTEVEPGAALYDTRAKYLHGSGARLHTPLRDLGAAERLRAAALEAWQALGLRDMARIDGFYEPGDGDREPRVVLTDVNGISGMGFSSFGFLQTALAGLGHGELVGHLVRRAAARAGVPVALRAGSARPHRERVHVLFGGPTSERQVSRQSGIFVGLVLASAGYDLRFVFMDRSARFTEVGLFVALHHDVHEIQALIDDPERRMAVELAARPLGRALGTEGGVARHLRVGPTTELAPAVEHADFVFLALHGGPGEDGTLQTALEALGRPYNGPGPECSRLCADKVEAARALGRASLAGVDVPRQRLVERQELLQWVREPAWGARFRSLSRELGAGRVVVKPARDGCSTGVKVLSDGDDLATFVHALVEMRASLPAGAFGPGSRPLALPEPPPERWLFEEALVDPEAAPLPEGDWNARSLERWLAERRYLELTCAVCEPPGRRLVAATPSLTIARAAELSLEEKFQQGFGTNLELDALLGEVRVHSLRERFAAIGQALGVRGYSRIDAFYDQREDRLVFLELNSLCALTEATVYYSQLLGSFGAAPAEALEWILHAGLAARAERAGASSLDAPSPTAER